MKERIAPIDGLRALAALGVLWTHTWTYFNNPRCLIGKFDLADIGAFGVNGVDLFFVISGFCMYYFYASKKDFTYTDFRHFLFKRWMRLSPAFYGATLIYLFTGIFVYHYNLSVIGVILHNFFYLNYILPQYIVASHFWTLSVEWQFYFIIPFLLIYKNRFNFKKIFLLMFGFLLLVGIISVFLFRNQLDQLTNSILFRGVEFGCGTIVAYLTINGIKPGKGEIWQLIIALLLIFAGRFSTSKPILSLSFHYYNLFKILGFTCMGLGFAGILYIALNTSGLLSTALSLGPLKKLGRISYSFYLLHALIYPLVSNEVMHLLPDLKNIGGPLLAAFISAIILYPLSLLSYRIFEKPFLKITNLNRR